jgi:N6-adenosine-specific RNA methylase IME4
VSNPFGLPEGGQYPVILCDPPWFYNNRKTGGERKDKTKFGGGAQKHYALMPDKTMLEFAGEVGRSVAARERAILFLWVTMPRLDLGMKFIEHAGFTYKTNGFTFIKTTKDGSQYRQLPGFYTSSNVELCLVATRGKGWKPKKAMTQSVIAVPLMEHSRKPAIHHQINEMYPDEKKIELFSRRREDLETWEFWGDQL